MSSRLFAASVAAVGNIVGSREIYPEKARELVDKALSSLSGNHLPVRCALLLATEAWCDPDDSVSARVREALKAKLGYEVPLIGGSTPRIYCSKSPTRIIDQGMVLVLLRSDDLWITVGSLANPYESEGKARQDRIGKFARDLRERAGVRLGIAAHRYLFGMLPGFRRNAQGRRIYRDNELLQEILAGFDHRYPLLGASAANAFIPERGFQFANDDCLVSGLALGFVENDLAAGTVMTHGLTRCTDKLVSVDELVDESGYLVGKMDGKPAAERLRELGEEFPNSALGNIIFGQPCDDDFHIILPILDSSNENGAVRLKRRVARGDRLHLLDATPDELHAATARAFDGAIRIACETHHELALVFGFSCIGRYHDFARRKPKWDEMVGRLAREYPPAPVVLSLCAGEFAVDEVRRPRSNNMSIWVSCFADRLAAHAQSRRLERTLVGAAEDLLACATAKQVMDKALKGAVAAGATGGQICIVDRKIGRIIGKGLGSALAAADSSHNWNEVAKLTDRKLTPRGVDELPHELEEFAMPVGTPVKASPAWQPQLSVAESPADDDILALIERTKYAIFVPDLPPGEAGRQAAKKFRCDPAAAAAGGIRCFLAIPLVGSGRSVIAALQLSFPDGTKLDREQFIAWIGYAQRIADILERVQESEERVILQRIADFANDLQHRRPTPDQGPTSWCQGYLRKVQDLLAADYVHMRVAQPDRAGELRLITPPTPLGRVHQATRPATHADDPYSGIPVMGSRIANTAAETQKFVALMTPQANEELWPELLRYFGEFQAAATFTLSDQTGVLGSFVIHSKQEYFLTERLRRMATVAADTAAALLRNQTQAYEYWRRTADHDFLEDLDSKLLDSPVPEDPEESRDWLRHVIEDLCQKFEADWGALFLADRAGERLILHTSYNWYAKNVEGKVEYRIREGWTGNVAVNSGDIISVLKDSHYRATQKYHDYIEPPRESASV